MLKLEKLTPEMFPDVDALTSEGFGARFPEKLKRKVFFTHGWSGDEGFGYGLSDSGKLVGLMGMIFSTRTFAGVTHRFCNLHSWYVKPEYRSRSLALLKPLMDLREHVITDFTASKEVGTISKRLGFSSLDNSAVILAPYAWSGKSDAELIDLSGATPAGIESLDEAQAKIYRDHQNLDCQFLLVRTRTETCFVVYSKIDRHLFPHALVHYLSHPALFAAEHAAIRHRLMRRTGGRYVVVESRMANGLRIPRSFTVFANEKFCRLPQPLEMTIDTLYSEVAIMKLSVLPTFPQRIRRLISPYVPEPILQRIQSSLAAFRR
jgi:hypothetical protein